MTMPFCEGANDSGLAGRVLYRDAMMLILNKPAGMPVHAGPSGEITLEHGLDSLRFGLPTRPGLAHRLDRDTSGCLVLGRHRRALRRLGQLFIARRVEKTYWAVVQGEPDDAVGTIDLPLAKVSLHKSRWQMKVDTTVGQTAITDYRVVARRGGLTWLALHPRTGRTHQIRVH
ncbi:MAG: Pseudouridine synthase, partial [Rhodospirillaceae bacterium]